VNETQKLKQQAARRAVYFIEPGMVVGLGHGSTALFAVQRIAELLNAGKLSEILGVPCSLKIEEEVPRLGIPLTSLDEHGHSFWLAKPDFFSRILGCLRYRKAGFWWKKIYH